MLLDVSPCWSPCLAGAGTLAHVGHSSSCSGWGVLVCFFLTPWYKLLILPAARSLQQAVFQQGQGAQPGLTNPSLLRVQLVRPRTGSDQIPLPKLWRKHKVLKTSEFCPSRSLPSGSSADRTHKVRNARRDKCDHSDLIL